MFKRVVAISGLQSSNVFYVSNLFGIQFSWIVLFGKGHVGFLAKMVDYI